MTHIQTNHRYAGTASRCKMPISLYISQWLLVGVCTLALPQSVVRGISYKNTKALHNAMIIGTVVIGAMTLIATWIGVLSKGVLTDTLQAYGAASITSPRLLSLAPWTLLGRITIIGPIAATISTVSSLLLASSSAIIKDVYMHECSKRHKTVPINTIRLFSMGATVILGLGVYFIAIAPPSVIWKINMFAFGGLETAFFWVLIFGLFWKKPTAPRRFRYGWRRTCLLHYYGAANKFFDLHQIVIGIGASLIFFLIATPLAKNTTNIFCVFSFPKSIAIKNVIKSFAA